MIHGDTPDEEGDDPRSKELLGMEKMVEAFLLVK